MSKRTERVLITPEGRILKKLRERKNLSMKMVADELEISDSYVSQIENGRANCPKGESLTAFLDLYGVKQKYFFEMCREWEKEITDEEFIRDSLGKLSPENLKFLKSMVSTMLSKS